MARAIEAAWVEPAAFWRCGAALDLRRSFMGGSVVSSLSQEVLAFIVCRDNIHSQKTAHNICSQ